MDTTLVVGGYPVEVVRKRIKNLHLAVYPPTGRIRVAMPMHLKDEAARLAVVARLGWVRRQQKRFLAQDRLGPREYVTGESHWYEGRRCRLDVVEARSGLGASLRRKGVIELRARPDADTAARARLLDAWHRETLRAKVPPLLDQWAPRLVVAEPSWSLRTMRTRWGSCLPTKGTIVLNPMLAMLPDACLEYVVVHELVHLIERGHGEQFQALLDRGLPNWRARQRRLGEFPLVVAAS